MRSLSDSGNWGTPSCHRNASPMISIPGLVPCRLDTVGKVFAIPAPTTFLGFAARRPPLPFGLSKSLRGTYEGYEERDRGDRSDRSADERAYHRVMSPLGGIILSHDLPAPRTLFAGDCALTTPYRPP